MIDSHSRIPTRFLTMMVAGAAFFGTTAVALSLLRALMPARSPAGRTVLATVASNNAASSASPTQRINALVTKLSAFELSSISRLSATMVAILRGTSAVARVTRSCTGIGPPSATKLACELIACRPGTLICAN